MQTVTLIVRLCKWMILVSHDLAVVGHLCERIAVMNRGEFVEEMADQNLREGRESIIDYA